MSTAKQLQLIVVTPEKAVLDEAAEMVIVPLFDGEAGIQAGHSPYVAQLGPGELRYKNGAVTQRLFIDGGFVQVRSNTVNVLTSTAKRLDELTEELMTAERSKADTLPATNPVETATKKKATDRVKAMLKVKSKSA
jgi:F-type H+-transporting ATPase subunit epsilon